MRVPRIYTDQPLQEGVEIELEAAAAHHVGRVLRMQPGRELVLFNGQGGEYRAQVNALGKKWVRVVLGEFRAGDRQSPLALELAIGISRGERMDLVLQKATELGVTRIAPLFTERTEVKLGGARLTKKIDHWRQVLISACEQCQRNLLPDLQTPTALPQWLASCEAERMFVLHHRNNQGLDGGDRPSSLALLIGPEGGLSDGEIQAAVEAGCSPLCLGPRILRTETAPLAAISVVQYLWGDLSS